MNVNWNYEFFNVFSCKVLILQRTGITNGQYFIVPIATVYYIGMVS